MNCVLVIGSAYLAAVRLPARGDPPPACDSLLFRRHFGADRGQRGDGYDQPGQNRACASMRRFDREITTARQTRGRPVRPSPEKRPRVAERDRPHRVGEGTTTIDIILLGPPGAGKGTGAPPDRGARAGPALDRGHASRAKSSGTEMGRACGRDHGSRPACHRRDRYRPDP